MKSKTCSKCGETKDISEYWKNAHNPDGLAYECINCRKKYKHKWDIENKEHLQKKWKEYRIKHKYKRREYCKFWRETKHMIVIQVYSDICMECELCGEDDIDVLTIDHIDGGGLKHLKTIPNRDLYAWLGNNNFPDGFRVLCWNCQHREKLRMYDMDSMYKEQFEKDIEQFVEENKRE